MQNHLTVVPPCSEDVRGESCAWQGMREIQQLKKNKKKPATHCSLLNKYYNIGSGTWVLLEVGKRKLNLGKLKPQCIHTRMHRVYNFFHLFFFRQIKVWTSPLITLILTPRELTASQSLTGDFFSPLLPSSALCLN